MKISSIKSPGSFLHALQALQAGLETGVPAGITQLNIDGKASSLADLHAELQGYADAYQAAEEAASVHTKTLQVREALAPKAGARYCAIRASVKVALGKKSPDLLKFGLAPNKAHVPLTNEQERDAIAKAKATRLARHTLGPKQKAAIKGRLHTENVSPPAATQAPSPAAAPTPGT